MSKLVCILTCLAALLIAPLAIADRITVTVTVTGTPADGNTFVLNSSTRTWRTAPTLSSEILIGSGIGANTTNLWQEIIASPFTGPVSPIWVTTNQFQLRGANLEAMTASITGTWASLTSSTQTVLQAQAVVAPLSSEPLATVRTNIASSLVNDIFNNGLPTNSAAATSPVLVSYVNINQIQTITGAKTFSNGANVYNGGLLTNATVGNIRVAYGLTNNGHMYFASGGSDPSYAIAPDSNGRPSIWTVTINGSFQRVLGTFIPYTPTANNLLTVSVANNNYGQLAGNNTWTGLNAIVATNSTVVASILTNDTYSGTVNTLSGGLYYSGTLSNTIARGTFEAYQNDNSNLEAGNGAMVTNGFTGSVALGRNARVGASSGTAVGKNTHADYQSSSAYGDSAAATEAHQVRLGTAAEYSSSPGGSAVGKNLVLGDVIAAAPSGMSNGRYMTNGAAASADPTNGGADWITSGEWQYRTSGTDEGAGQVNHVHNRGEQVTGSGADFTIAGTTYARVDFGGTDPEILLPTAGTYLISAVVSIVAGGTANDDFRCKLYNSTDAADITSSDRRNTNIGASQTGQLVLQNVYTVSSGSKTIQIYGQNLTAARGTIEAQRTSLTYVRLY